MLKVTPKMTNVHADKRVEKFYSQGILTLSSEYSAKSGKLLKDVFMNSNGTKPIRITKYDDNEHAIKESFFADNGKHIGDIDYSEIGHFLNFVL